MKLLTPSQNKDLNSQQTVKQVLRIQELEKATTQALQSLAKAEAEFNATLARNRDKWALEEEEHFKRTKERETEIDFLEAKRINALIPIGIIKEATEDRMEEAVKLLSGIRMREQKAEKLIEQLETKLDEVGQREVDVNQKEKTLVLRQEGIELQSHAIVEGSRKLNQATIEFKNLKEKEEKAIKDRKTELFLIERSLISKEETLKLTDKALNDLATQLADERGTLDRAWQELKRKQISS